MTWDKAQTTWSNHTNNRPLTAETLRDSLYKAKAVIDQLPKLPTAYVMTTRSLQAIRDCELKHSQGMPLPDEHKGVLYKSLLGIPVEHYATLRECFDRMVAAREGERLQLLMSDNEMTSDLIGHPYMAKSGRRKAVAEYMEREKDIDMLGW